MLDLLAADDEVWRAGARLQQSPELALDVSSVRAIGENVQYQLLAAEDAEAPQLVGDTPLTARGDSAVEAMNAWRRTSHQLTHLSAAELAVGTDAALAEVEPEHGPGAPGVPERSPDERSQRSLDLLSQ